MLRAENREQAMPVVLDLAKPILVFKHAKAAAKQQQTELKF
jgi:hypothetical protein